MARNGGPTPRWSGWPLLAQLAILSALLAAGITLILTFELLPSRYQFHEGDVANVNIKSPLKVTYISPLLTKTERDKAAAAVDDVTEFDVGAAAQQTKKAEDLLSQIVDVRRSSGSLEQRENDLSAIPGLSLSSASRKEALSLDETQWLVVSFETRRVLGQVMEERFDAKQQPEVVKRLQYMVDQALPVGRQTLVAEIAAGLVRPTVLVDAEATATAREAARAAVQPVHVTVEKGEIILRDGDIVKDTDIEKLEQVGLSNPTVNWTHLAGNAMIATLVALLLAAYLYLFQPTVWPKPRRLTLVYAVILVALLAARLTVPGRDYYAYLFPVAAVPM
ncbi:MAG: hypothetical protein ACYC1C_19255, partial [Chloroflexota bacterium]